jgi:hypothetical protein
VWGGAVVLLGNGAQRHGGAGPRPATGGRPAGEKQGRGKRKRREELTLGWEEGADRRARSGSEGRRGRGARGVCWAGCWAGPCGEGKEEGRAGPRVRERREVWAGWAGLFSFPFLFSKLNLIQTILIEFKIQFEFKPINSTQMKQCCSMNAPTI